MFSVFKVQIVLLSKMSKKNIKAVFKWKPPKFNISKISSYKFYYTLFRVFALKQTTSINYQWLGMHNVAYLLFFSFFKKRQLALDHSTHVADCK